jgi:hypothetical protein
MRGLKPTNLEAVMDNSLFSWELTKRNSLFGLHPLDIKTPARRTILPVSTMDTLCLWLPSREAGHPLDSVTWMFSSFTTLCPQRLCFCLDCALRAYIDCFFCISLSCPSCGACVLPLDISVCDSLRIGSFCWLLHPSLDVKDVGYVIVCLSAFFISIILLNYHPFQKPELRLP